LRLKLDFSQSPLPLPAVPEYNPSVQSLRAELQNLPSDSQIAPKLIDMLWERTPADERINLNFVQLCTSALKQCHANVKTVRDIIQRLDHYLLNDRKMSPDLRTFTMKEIFQKARVEWKIQRQFFAQWRNSFRGWKGDYCRWLSLGAFPCPEKQTFTIDPKPENIYPFNPQQTYTIQIDGNTRQARFRLTKPNEPATEYWKFHLPKHYARRAYITAYHAGVIRSPKKMRAYLYVSRHKGTWKSTSIAIWFRGISLAKITMRPWSTRLYRFPVELDQGDNFILIRGRFWERWDLKVFVGDIRGAPIEDLEIFPAYNP
ncbi:MAG: hypothetical protein D6820_01435, partial [Lentisphaerae bacterium]